MKLSKDHGNGRVLYDWWHDVTQARDKGADRAARAILRRAHDITAVTLSQPYQHLFQRMREAKWDDGFPRSNDALAAVAGLLVHVDADAGSTGLAECMGQCPQGSDRPYVDSGLASGMSSIRAIGPGMPGSPATRAAGGKGAVIAGEA